MLQKILNLFKRDGDPNLTAIKKAMEGKRNIYQKLDEEEQTFLMLRLAGKSADEIAAAVNCGPMRLEMIEQIVISKLQKAK